MSIPGRIEIDRSGPEPMVSVGHPPGPFTLTELRMYGEYLTTLAAEAAKPVEPEVDELAAVIDASRARYLQYPESIRVLARDLAAAGYERTSAATGGETP